MVWPEDFINRIICGDALGVMRQMPAGCVDAVITDPPYPEIDREYGRMTEAAWWDMMMGVCQEVRRILKPTGSAVFILQPNSRKVGSMRGWLWEFMAWVCREWNMVQDVWWWNTTALPTGVCSPRNRGLTRQSVKPCIWAGPPNCFRNQDAVLKEPVMHKYHAKYIAAKLGDERKTFPSGQGKTGRFYSACEERGGTIPFNLLPIGVSGVATGNPGHNGHGAGTPLELAKWWTRYICPPGGVILDPFMGSGTMGLAAKMEGCHYIGIDKMPKYCQVAETRLGRILL